MALLAELIRPRESSLARLSGGRLVISIQNPRRGDGKSPSTGIAAT
ncbi:hypothetical protein Rhow_001975 [Rhodococcus wratislaviensis]|uniref:Uncharacterized protein n=1 Tax=Rhodococcus wratislaviensis TaxID=44752 RepID=A0A402BZ36_RHOWR|nr:hypothetical protein Rhow_001975 [Rhodococcus wratislaviensis]